MNKTIDLHPNTSTRISIAVEGNDLVQHVFIIDPTKPRMWIDGMQYHFNSHLSSTTRVSGKRLPVMVFGNGA